MGHKLFHKLKPLVTVFKELCLEAISNSLLNGFLATQYIIFISSWRRTHSHVDPPKKIYGTRCNFSSKIAKLLCSNPFFPTFATGAETPVSFEATLNLQKWSLLLVFFSLNVNCF